MTRFRTSQLLAATLVSVAATTLAFASSSHALGTVGTCDIEYSPRRVTILGDQDQFAPVATYDSSASGWVAPAAMYQWISLNTEPWESMSGGFTPANTSISAPQSPFDLLDSLNFFLNVPLPLDNGGSYTMNVAFTTTSDDPSEAPGTVLCRTSITVRYYDTLADSLAGKFSSMDPLALDTADQPLPNTGSSTTSFVLSAMGALLAGASMLVVRRRVVAH